MFFTWAFTIALLYANYFDLYAARVMRYGRHVKYGNDHNDELNMTVYSDLCVLEYGKYKCTSILSKGYKIPPGTDRGCGNRLEKSVFPATPKKSGVLQYSSELVPGTSTRNQ